MLSSKSTSDSPRESREVCSNHRNSRESLGESEVIYMISHESLGESEVIYMISHESLGESVVLYMISRESIWTQIITEYYFILFQSLANLFEFLLAINLL